VVAELAADIAELFEALAELQSGSFAAVGVAYCQMETGSVDPGSQSAVVASAEAGSP
jgi:hypothetical protein